MYRLPEGHPCGSLLETGMVCQSGRILPRHLHGSLLPRTKILRSPRGPQSPLPAFTSSHPPHHSLPSNHTASSLPLTKSLFGALCLEHLPQTSALPPFPPWISPPKSPLREAFSKAVLSPQLCGGLSIPCRLSCHWRISPAKRRVASFTTESPAAGPKPATEQPGLGGFVERMSEQINEQMNECMDE